MGYRFLLVGLPSQSPPIVLYKTKIIFYFANNSIRCNKSNSGRFRHASGVEEHKRNNEEGAAAEERGVETQNHTNRTQQKHITFCSKSNQIIVGIE